MKIPKITNQIPCDDFSCFTKHMGAEVDVTPAPMEVFDEGYSRNFILNSDTLHEFNETITTSTDKSTHDTNSDLTWACYENLRWSDFN